MPAPPVPHDSMLHRASSRSDHVSEWVYCPHIQPKVALALDITHILDGLNERQREAVTAPVGNLLVVAGAGSGKTRVLVHRIAYLVEALGASPGGILAVTFTNKAAAEMRGRVERLLEGPARAMWVGTFHGIAHRLAAHALAAGRTSPELPDTRCGRPASAGQTGRCEYLRRRRAEMASATGDRVHQLAQGRRPAAPRTSQVGRPRRVRDGSPRHLRRPTKHSAARADWSISRNSCCAATNCYSPTTTCGPTTGAASGTSSSTSSRTRTPFSTPGCVC